MGLAICSGRPCPLRWQLEAPEAPQKCVYCCFGLTFTSQQCPRAPNHSRSLQIHASCHRRRGLALEALTLFLAYCYSQLGVVRFMAKIGEANAPSLALFESTLGFKEVRRVAVSTEQGWKWLRPFESVAPVQT